MTTEELLQPRRKVLIDYPDSEYSVGQVIHFKDKSTAYTGTNEWQSEFIKNKNGGGGGMRCIKYFEPYPLIFRPMEWWEERKVEDMPEYVKDENEPGEYEIIKVQKWEFVNGQAIGIAYHNHAGGYSVTYLLPATEQEYNEYQKNR